MTITVDYEGTMLRTGDRVELHPSCDLWMRGARYGDVVALNGYKVTVQLDRFARPTVFNQSNVRKVG